MNVKLTTNKAGGKTYWQAYWRDQLGIKRRRSLGPRDAMTKREALAACQQIARDEAVIGKYERHKAPTMTEWAAQYFHVREHELTPGTMLIQSKAVDYFIEHLGDVRLDRIDRAAAESWVAWLAKREGRLNDRLSPATVASHVRAIKTILRRAQRRWRTVDAQVFDGLGTASVASEWEPVIHDQMTKILEACPDDHWRRLFALCRYAGLRLGEALRLEWKDINWQDRTLTVRNDSRRETTKKRARVVPISPRLYPILEAGLLTDDGTDDRVAAVGVNNIDRNARATILRAGVAEYHKPFHSLRKTLESEWLAEHPVMTVTKWLGHSPAVAAKHYHTPSVEEIKAVTSGNDSSEVAALRAQIEELTSKLAQTGHKSIRNASVYGSRACNNL